MLAPFGKTKGLWAAKRAALRTQRSEEGSKGREVDGKADSVGARTFLKRMLLNLCTTQSLGVSLDPRQSESKEQTRKQTKKRANWTLVKSRG